MMYIFFKLENQQKQNFSEATDLREKMKSLWNKLEVDESERQAFVMKNVGCKPSVISKVSYRKHSPFNTSAQKEISGLSGFLFFSFKSSDASKHNMY